MKALSQDEFRKKLFNIAKKYGFEVDLVRIWNRYDPLLKQTKDPKEFKQISIMANVEQHKLFGFRDALVVDGEEILPAAENYSLEKDIENITKI